MKDAKPTSLPRPAYRSDLRQAQAAMTKERVQRALADILEEGGDAEAITFRQVARKAGVTEMTVYRHYPNRAALLQGLWEYLNRQMGPEIGMPTQASELRRQHLALFEGFDRIPAQINASITTPQGREMRAALNVRRRKAFLNIVAEAAPDLSHGEQLHAAAILQLLHSAYAWASLREQWKLSGAAAGTATLWAIDTLLRDLKRRNKPAMQHQTR